MSKTPRRPPPARTPRRASDYATVNLEDWERTAEGYEVRHRRMLIREGGRAWGTWRIPERSLGLLGPVAGRDVLELGCGAAWWSVALARDGARVVGLDFSPARLRQARVRMEAAGLDFPLVRARAERIPYPNDRFDLVLSDYGATTFADPRRVVPEVARVLRRGGRFVFAHASPFRSVTQQHHPDRQSRRLVRDYFGLHSIRTPDSVEFQLPYGEWIGLFAANALAVDALIERPAPRSRRSSYVSREDQEWALHWPYESIWSTHKMGAPRRTIRRDPRASR